ncbi:transmembrane protein 205 [Arapaima gigas]
MVWFVSHGDASSRGCRGRFSPAAQRRARQFRRRQRLCYVLLLSGEVGRGKQDTAMATEGQPTDLVKVLHLLLMSFTWGTQVWVSFIAGFVLVSSVSRHTFGQVQSKLFPFYFYSLLGTNAVSLALFAVYHPRELLDWHESVQMILYFSAVILVGLNAQWFGPAVTDFMLKMQEVEREHGLGGNVGMGSDKEAYAKLREQDPKYKATRASFFCYHGLSSLCNLLAFLCSTVNLVYTALHLRTI